MKPIRTATVLLLAFLLAACSGIPGSSAVHDVRTVTNQVGDQAPVTPAAGLDQNAIVQGFIKSAARISLAGGSAAAYAAPMAYLTAKARETWQSKAVTKVIVLSNQYRTQVSPTDSAVVVLRDDQPVGSLDAAQAFHADPAAYSLSLHLVRESGQWRISDPPAALLIARSDFANVYSSKTLYFLDASHTVVVPDVRYLINGGSIESRVTTLISLLLRGPAGVLQGAAQSELTGGKLRTNVTIDTQGVTQVDLQDLNPEKPADVSALAAQIVWSIGLEVGGQVAIRLNGAPLEAKQLSYKLSTVESFSPDRVPGNASVASDPYYIARTESGSGLIVDLQTGRALYGAVGTGSADVESAAMSAANGTLAAVSRVDRGTAEELLIGKPLSSEPTVPALKAQSLTQPSFSRSGDEVWVVQVQSGTSKTPEIYRISTGSTTTGVPSRAKVGAAGLAGKGAVTALTLSPDGVRVAIIAGGRLYLGAIAAPASAGSSADTTSTGAPGSDSPDALSVVNLQQVRTDLTNVTAVAFSTAKQLLVVSAGLPYQSINSLSTDGFALDGLTTVGLTQDITGMAVSIVDATGDVGGATPAAVAPIYVSFGGQIYKLSGNQSDGEWVPAGTISTPGVSPFFPN